MPHRGAAVATLLLLVLAGCGAANPDGSGRPDVSTALPTASPQAASPPAVATSFPTANPSPALPSRGATEPADPADVLTGRAIEALGDGGVDVVLRVGMDGFVLPDERLFDVHGGRVLSVRQVEGSELLLVVRDLEGRLIREIPTRMDIPQTGIVRGEDVYFAGVDVPNGDIDQAVDRGVWVAHGDAAPELVLRPGEGLAVYETLDRSPDERTVGIWRCGEACSTILVREDAEPVEIPRPGLIALTNEVALLIGRFRDVMAHSVADGRELWRAATSGVYYGRYAMTGSERFVLTAMEEPDNPGAGSDQLRIEVLDALTGAVGRTVVVPTDEPLLFVAPTLSTDRYAAIVDSVLPTTDAAPHVVQVVDLEAGRLLDVTLRLGDAR